MTELRAEHPFSITRGGPFYHLMRRLHLTTQRGDLHWRALALFAWLPAILSALVALLARDRHDPMLYDVSVHARFLIALPLIIMAEHALERRCRSAMRRLRAGRFANRAAVDTIIDRVEHLRDSWLAEGLLFAIAFAFGQAALWGWIPPAGVVHGVETSEPMSIARLWYGGVGLPLCQFLLLRWLWRWALWTYLLARLSRLRLAMIAIHPDHAGGLVFLDEPIDAFALLVASVASVAAAAWSSQVYSGHATVQTFVSPFFGFLALSLVLAFGPLALFSGHLYRARRRDLPLHHELALTYVRDFKHKWLQRHPRPGEPVLGTPDLQSLNDLGGGFETTEKTRMMPISPRPVVLVALAALIPMVPVVLTAVPLRELVEHFGKALIGGLPI